MEFRQDLIPLAKLGFPGSLLLLQLAEAVLANFGQADPVQSVPAHLERMLTLVLLPLESLVVPGVQLVKGEFSRFLLIGSES